nr:uncharacterized protein LOC114822689 [Malus domestica]
MGMRHHYYQPLLLAAITGDWESARTFLERDPEAVTAVITSQALTALHVAAKEGQWQFIMKLVELMPAEALAARNILGQTALHNLAISGDSCIEAAKSLVTRNPALPQITDTEGFTALLWGCMMAPETSKEMRWYLVLVTRDDFPSSPFTGPLAGTIICSLSTMGFFVVPVELNYEPPPSVREGSGVPPRSGEDVEIPIPIPSKVMPLINHVRETKSRHKCAEELARQVYAHASSMNSMEILRFFLGGVNGSLDHGGGTVEVPRMCIENFPDLLWVPALHGDNILQRTIFYRRENMYNILKECTNGSTLLSFGTGTTEDTILHTVAKLAPLPRLKSVSGPAFQLQRELQWFKEHKGLLKEGKKWMKDTSNSCMIVAALIATIVFAAAFTMPGGNTSDNKGTPIFLRSKTFMLYAISDAVALFSSLTSLLMFLSILTARYAEEDFLESLPKRLIIGLALLFLAIAATMIVFCATLAMALGERFTWISLPITLLLASFPVALFVMLQLPLFMQMVQSTYGSSIFCK